MYNFDISKSKLENLVIFRHGKAENPFDANNDFERNLVESGTRDAKNQASRLFDLGFEPDTILVSSANRALQTFEAAKDIFPNAEVSISRELYLASIDTYMDEVLASNGRNVILIAHDPGLHELCRYFLKGEKETKETTLLKLELKTAGIAWFKRNLKRKSQMKLVASLIPIKSAD